MTLTIGSPQNSDTVASAQAEKLKALFESWAQEDAEHFSTMTIEEIAAEDAKSDKILRNIANGTIELRTMNWKEEDFI